MRVQRIAREKVCAVNYLSHKAYLKSLITAPASAAAVALLCLGLSSVAQGAAETKLKEANTSIGVLPTNATNQWKLITDPVIEAPAPSDDPNIVVLPFDPMNYIVIGGILSNKYDASQFHLLQTVEPPLGPPALPTYATGVSVEGFAPAGPPPLPSPYQITSFDVLMNGGGDVKVSVDPINPAVDDVKYNGDVTDGEKGEVDDITFSLIGDLRQYALTANNDQNFFDLVLVDNPGVTGPPTTGTVFGGPNGVIDLGPTDPTDPTVVPITFINPESVPEPASASLMLVSAGFMGLRRRKPSTAV